VFGDLLYIKVINKCFRTSVLKLKYYNLIYVFLDDIQINFKKAVPPKCSVEQIRRTIAENRIFIRYEQIANGLKTTTGNYFIIIK